MHDRVLTAGRRENTYPEKRAAAHGVTRTAATSGLLEMVTTFRGQRQIPTTLKIQSLSI
jgi:hypothetical protein